MSELFDLGLALLSGRGGPSWEARARGAHRALVGLLGAGAPRTPVLPKAPPRRTATAFAAFDGPERAEAERLAESFLLHFLRGEMEVLPELLDEQVWAYWPRGGLGYHPAPPLAAELAARVKKPEEPPVALDAVATYSAAQMRGVMPRGLPWILEAILEVKHGLLLCADVMRGDEKLGRLMVSLRKEDHRWVVTSLPLPAPDGAIRASVITRAVDDEALFVGEQVVKRVVYGQANSLQAEAHYMAEPLWVRDRMISRDALIGVVADGAHRLGAADTVFMGTTKLELDQVRKFATGPAAAKCLDEIGATMRLPLRMLDAHLAVTKLGTFDPSSDRVTEEGEIATVIVRMEATDTDRARRKVAGLFI